MPAAAAGVAVAGSYLSSKGKKRQAKRAAQAASAANVMAQARQLNPWLFGALGGPGQPGQAGQGGYQQGLYNIAQQPGYIDPRLMNAPYLQSAQRQQQDLQAAQAMLGRSQIGGTTGLGQAYALANQAARTGRDVGIGQQYALWTEQQRRADLDWISGQVARSQGMGGDIAQTQAELALQAPNWMTNVGGMAQAGLAAYGAAKGMGGGGGISTGSWGQGMTLPPMNSSQWQQSPYPNLQYVRG